MVFNPATNEVNYIPMASLHVERPAGAVAVELSQAIRQATVTPAETFSMPMLPQPQVMPKPTTTVFPTITGTAAVVGEPVQPDISPAQLLRPMPSIVTSQVADIRPCNGFAQWVADNPAVALAGLVLLGMLAVGGGRR